MTAVLLSIKPEWWEKILSGEKTMEIRKTAPSTKRNAEMEWPLTVFVYVSGTGGVQGKFSCGGYVKTNLFKMLVERSCVPIRDLYAYAGGKQLCAWLISEPEKFDTPSPLAEFGLTHSPVSWQYIEIPDEMEAEHE